jgi:inward rectifier potassium channel
MSAARPSQRTAAQARRRDRRDGTMTVRVGAYELSKKGGTRYDWRDPYHLAVSLSWPGFFACFVAFDFVLNLLFAILYLLQPRSVANARPGSVSDAFFFSLETLATVGYGVMAPATLYGHIISGIEIVVGMMFVAIMTGLTFVRFSRPRGKFLWAEKAVVTTYNGRRTLMVRLGNGRSSMLTDANARLAALIGERTHEGQFFRRIHELSLQRSRLPLFALTWTLMHDIDERSPLHGHDAESYAASDVRLFVAVDAHDRTLAARVSDMKDYGGADIAFGMRYSDAVSVDDEGRTIADLGRLSFIEPELTPHATPGDAGQWAPMARGKAEAAVEEERD